MRTLSSTKSSAVRTAWGTLRILVAFVHHEGFPVLPHRFDCGYRAMVWAMQTRKGTRMNMNRLPVCLVSVAVILCAALVGAQQAGEPVHFNKLLPFLPDKVDGFTAEKARGSTGGAMGFKMTEVSRIYHKGAEDAPERVTVKITDGTVNQYFAAAYAAASQFSNETTEGYEKGFTLDGYQAVEKYSTESKNGQLTVMVGGRYLVEIDIDGLESKDLQEWWKKIDAKKLAELKP